MSAREKRVIADCFDNGTVGEDCDDCMAHPSNDPEDACCYGSEHEYHDKTCTRCPHENDCAQLTHGITSRSSRTIRRPSKLRLRSRRTKNESLIAPSPVNRTPKQTVQEGDMDTEEAFMKKLGRATGWGMIEGGLQMALDFFQRNRPK